MYLLLALAISLLEHDGAALLSNPKRLSHTDATRLGNVGHTLRGTIKSVAFSAKTRTLVACSDYHLAGWQLSKGQCMALEAERGYLFDSLQIAPDGGLIAVARRGLDTVIDLRAGRDGRLLSSFRYAPHAVLIRALAFTQDGSRVAFGGSDGNVTIVDTSNGMTQAQFHAGDNWIMSVSLSEGGERLAFGDDNGGVWVWDVVADKIVLHERMNKGAVRTAVFSDDARTLVTAGDEDDKLFVWDSARGKLIRTVALGKYVGSIALSPDGKTAVVGLGRSELAFVDLAKGVVLDKLAVNRDFGAPILFTTSKQVAWAANNSIRFADIEAKRFRTSSQDFDGSPVVAVSYCAGGDIIVTAQEDSAPQLWSAKTNKKLCDLSAKDATGPAVALSAQPAGDLIACAYYGSSDIYIWSARQAAVKKVLSQHLQPVTALGFGLDEKSLWSTDKRHALVVWDIPSFSARDACGPYKHGAGPCAVSKSGLVAHVLDQKAIVVRKGQALPETQRFSAGVDPKLIDASYYAVTVHPERDELAVRRYWGEVEVIDLPSGKIRWRTSDGEHFANHRWGGKLCLEYSPCGRLLVSAGANGTIRLHEAKRGRCVGILDGDSGGITAIGFSPNGDHLISGSNDGTVLVWRIGFLLAR